MKRSNEKKLNRMLLNEQDSGLNLIPPPRQISFFMAVSLFLGTFGIRLFIGIICIYSVFSGFILMSAGKSVLVFLYYKSGIIIFSCFIIIPFGFLITGIITGLFQIQFLKNGFAFIADKAEVLKSGIMIPARSVDGAFNRLYKIKYIFKDHNKVERTCIQRTVKPELYNDNELILYLPDKNKAMLYYQPPLLFPNGLPKIDHKSGTFISNKDPLIYTFIFLIITVLLLGIFFLINMKYVFDAWTN